MTTADQIIARALAPDKGTSPARTALRESELGQRSPWSKFTTDLAALVLATAIVLLAAQPTTPAIVTAADLVWPIAVIVTVLVALLLNGAWDSRAQSLRGAEFTAPCHGYAWAIASLSVLWSVLGVEDEQIWILCTLPIALALSLVLRHGLSSLTRRSTGTDPVATSVILVGDRAGVSAFLTQCKGKRLSYWSLDAVCLAGSPLANGAPESISSVPIVGTASDLYDLVHRNGYKMVILLPSAGLGPEQVRDFMWRLEDERVNLMIAPPLVDIASTRLQVATIAGIPLLHLRERSHGGPGRVAKAALDRLAAVLGILVTLPILAVIALAIRLTSKGPALYRQTRTGTGQRPFTIYKFRTMVTGADAMTADLEIENDSSGPLFKCFTDPRVTRLGHFLRRYSLDELPQLFNVAMGDMSLVGPRPPLPAEVQRYTTEHERRRLLVRPGITGLWQVSGRSDLSWEQTIRHDLFYVENWSPGLDLSILWKTLGAVASGRGAY